MNPSSYQATGNPTLPTTYSNASNNNPAGGNYRDPTSAGPAALPPREAYTHNLISPSNSSAVLGEPLAGSTAAGISAAPPANDTTSKLAQELNQFSAVANQLRQSLSPAPTFAERCRQAFDVANDLFANAPTWVCFYRELMGASGLLHVLFDNNKEFGSFLRTDQHHQIQLMLTALRSRDLPENDPNDPQRMITVRLPKSLHEAMCEEAGRLNISVNRLCISRMLQLLDPEMIPETNSKPRGRKPRTRTKPTPAPTASTPTQANS